MILTLTANNVFTDALERLALLKKENEKKISKYLRALIKNK